MAEIKCEKCGTVYHDGINHNCPNCGTPSPNYLNQPEKPAQEQVQPDAPKVKAPVSARIGKWGMVHTVLGWVSVAAMVIILIVGLTDWDDWVSYVIGSLAAGCIYFFTAGICLKGFAEIVLKTERKLKEQGVTTE